MECGRQTIGGAALTRHDCAMPVTPADGLVLAKGFEGYRVAARRAFGEGSTPPAEIVEPAMFEADLGNCPKINKPHGFVQANAGFVGRNDARERRMKTLPCEQIEEPDVQRPADPAAVTIAGRIDSGLDRPAIGGLGAMRAAIRISQYAMPVVKNQERMGFLG